MTTGTPTAADYYSEPIADDFRQGDIYVDILHVMLSEPDWIVVKEFDDKGGRKKLVPHTPSNPPKALDWERERVVAGGQFGMAVVLTHDCEIENSDERNHRLVALLRPFDGLSPDDQETIITNRHIGRLYLPAWANAGLPESYLDLRRITTLRDNALPGANRILSMTDYSRRILQASIIRYLTELYRPPAEQPI